VWSATKFRNAQHRSRSSSLWSINYGQQSVSRRGGGLLSMTVASYAWLSLRLLLCNPRPNCCARMHQRAQPRQRCRKGVYLRQCHCAQSPGVQRGCAQGFFCAFFFCLRVAVRKALERVFYMISRSRVQQIELTQNMQKNKNTTTTWPPCNLHDKDAPSRSARGRIQPSTDDVLKTKPGIKDLQWVIRPRHLPESL